MKMELWIRNQDKMDLFKINRLKIREHTFEDGKKEYFILNNNSISDVVGVYKTKERAIEVLDEIQNFMIDYAWAKKINRLGEEIDLIPKPILIYNMPKK